MITDYLYELLGEGKLTSKGDEIHWCCPFCGDTRYRLYVNVFTHKVYCHNCQYAEHTVVKLIADIEGIPYKKAYEIYKDYHGYIQIPESVVDEVTDVLLLKYDLNIQKSAIPLPESFTLLYGNNSLASQKFRKYLYKRKVEDRHIKIHKWGFCYKGQYKNRIILTIHEEGNLKFWVARAINKRDVPKELSPSDKKWQISKSEVVFNIDRAAKIHNIAVITEGIFDAVTFGDMGTAILGSVLSEEQLCLYLKYKDYLKAVYVALDEDAVYKSFEIMQELSKYIPVYICDIKGDPNEMGKRRCLEALENAEEFTPLLGIRKILKG